MTLKEAGERLGVDPETLRIQIAKGRLRAEKHGRDWWVTSAEVDRYARESRGKIGRPAGSADRAPRARKP